MPHTYTTDDLYAFGDWADDHHVSLGSQSAWYAVEKDNVPKSTKKKVYKMTDEKANAIDKAVCQLTNRDWVLGRLFTEHYVLGYSERELAVKHKCSRSSIGRKISYASGLVIGAASTYETK